MVRAYLEHGMKVWPQPVRLWMAGPMFRAERPQKGRYRQFHQVNYEALGSENPILDAEAVVLLYECLKELGLRRLKVKLSSVGDPEDRARYNAYLREVLSPTGRPSPRTPRSAWSSTPCASWTPRASGTRPSSRSSG